MPESTVIIFHPDRCVPSSVVGHSFDGLELKPGRNILADYAFAKLNKNASYPQYLKWGAIQVLGGEKEVNIIDPEANIELENLAQFSVESDDIPKLLAVTVDIETLEKWRLKESRANVRAQIAQRIKVLKQGNE